MTLNGKQIKDHETFHIILFFQVMYMRYILEHKHKQPGSKFAAENIFILALDGDVKFEPEAVLSLMRRLKESSKIGAACGRIHPIGAGM